MNIVKLMVLGALEQVMDPEVGLDVISLGLIYGLEVSEEKVHVKLSLTSPGCPMGAVITEMIQKALEGVAGKRQVEIELVWEPVWSPEMISPEGKIALGT